MSFLKSRTEIKKSKNRKSETQKPKLKSRSEIKNPKSENPKLKNRKLKINGEISRTRHVPRKSENPNILKPNQRKEKSHLHDPHQRICPGIYRTCFPRRFIDSRCQISKMATLACLRHSKPQITITTRHSSFKFCPPLKPPFWRFQ
jgi:hypothetical protein